MNCFAQFTDRNFLDYLGHWLIRITVLSQTYNKYRKFVGLFYIYFIIIYGYGIT